MLTRPSSHLPAPGFSSQQSPVQETRGYKVPRHPQNATPLHAASVAARPPRIRWGTPGRSCAGAPSCFMRSHLTVGRLVPSSKAQRALQSEGCGCDGGASRAGAREAGGRRSVSSESGQDSRPRGGLRESPRGSEPGWHVSLRRRSTCASLTWQLVWILVRGGGRRPISFGEGHRRGVCDHRRL